MQGTGDGTFWQCLTCKCLGSVVGVLNRQRRSLLIYSSNSLLSVQHIGKKTSRRHMESNEAHWTTGTSWISWSIASSLGAFWKGETCTPLYSYPMEKEQPPPQPAPSWRCFQQLFSLCDLAMFHPPELHHVLHSRPFSPSILISPQLPTPDTSDLLRSPDRGDPLGRLLGQRRHWRRLGRWRGPRYLGERRSRPKGAERVRVSEQTGGVWKG